MNLGRKIILIMSAFCILVFILANSMFGSTSYCFSGTVNALLKLVGIEISEFALRKIAHLAEYGLLGIILMMLFQKKKWRILIVLMIGAATGTADELIQSLSPLRHALVKDVLLDVIGAGVGGILVSFSSGKWRTEI